MGETRAVEPSLIVTDLDGTLWHTDDEVHGDVVKALGRVLESGPPLLVATGRRVTSTRVPLARIGVAPAAIVLNGALGLDLATNIRFHRAPYRAAEATQVLDAFQSVGLSPCIYVDEHTHEVCVSDSPSTNPGHLADLGTTAGVTDLETVVRDVVVLGFSIIGVDHGTLVAAAEAVDDIAEVHLDRALDYPGRASLTVAPLGQSKWDGVLAFCDSHDIDPDRVVALGDGPNDVELLTGAAIALVPEHAHPAALAVADLVIPPPAQGGWARVLDLL